MHVTRSRFFALLLLAACASLPARAAYDTVMMRGVTPDKVYSTDGVETVDTYSGNLMLNIPVGPRYQTNGTLGYQFTLSYNSKAWDYLARLADADEGVILLGDWSSFTSVEGAESVPASGTNAGLGWRLMLGGDVNFRGFDVINGVRYARLSFTTADGAEHIFYDQLHGPNSATTMPERRQHGSGPWYTRDGSYLRMRKSSPAGVDTTAGVRRFIDFPDGSTYTVQCITYCDTVYAEWRTVEIADRVGARLVIDHGAGGRPNPPVGAMQKVAWTWTIQEKFQETLIRQHQIEFEIRRREGGTANTLNQHLEIYVKKVRLAPTPTPSGMVTPEYTFQYHQTLLNREVKSTWPYRDDLYVPFAFRGTSPQRGYIDTALLRRVVLPAAVAGGSPAGEWQFRYYGDGIDASFPDTAELQEGPVPPDSTWTYYRSKRAGLLAEAIYPTGRGTRMKYGERVFARSSCFGTFRDNHDSLTAIRQRTMTRWQGTSRVEVPGSSWTYYEHAFNHSPVGDCTSAPREAVAAVIEPAGKVTLTFYSIFIDGLSGTTGAWKQEDFGLPFSYAEVAEGAGAGMPVSSHEYDCRATDLHAIAAAEGDLGSEIRRMIARYREPGEGSPCGENNALPLRTTYVQYEYAGTCEPSERTCWQANARVSAQKSVFFDVCDSTGCTRGETSRYILTQHSDFDGLGHYRRSRITSDLPRELGQNVGYDDDRLEITRYNPTRKYSPSTRAFDNPILQSDPWVLGTYDRTERREGGRRFGARHVFDVAKGLLTETRTLAATPASTNDTPETFTDIATSDRDLRVTFQRSFAATGSEVREQYFGGDTASAGATSPQFHILRSSNLGAIVTLGYLNCDSTQIHHASYSAVVDPSSGLTTSATDGKRRTLSMTYDALSRIVSLTPKNEAPINHSYPPLVHSTTAQVETTRSHSTMSGSEWTRVSATDQFEVFSRSGSSGTVLAVETLRSSGAGTQAGAAETGRSMRWYLPNGWLRAETSVSKSAADAAITDYLHDVFGRVVVETPLHANQKIEYTYTGPWKVRKKINGVALHTSEGGTSTFTESLSDAFGRLIQIVDFSDPLQPGATVPTRYGYNASNNLISVTMTRKNAAGANVSQQRTFTHDGRGFLLSERHPELKSSGVQWEYRYTYDARGNVRRRLLRTTAAAAQSATATFVKPAFTDQDLAYNWSIAELLLSVELPGDGGQRLLKKFDYDGALVRSARRINYVHAPQGTSLADQWPITTEFTHDDSGRLTAKRLVAPAFTATTSYTYNAFGLVASVGYPRLAETCRVLPCRVLSNVRTISYGYFNGLLESVTASGTGATTLVSNVLYHPNQLWKTIFRNGRSTDQQEVLDGNQMLPRPSKIYTEGRWGSELGIVYDGAGNVQRIGATDGAERHRYFYDAALRLRQGNVRAGGSVVNQLFTYDGFGNLASIGLGNAAATTIPVDSATNRLSTNARYDASGNLTIWRDPRKPTHELQLAYDALNRATGAQYLDPVRQLQYGRIFLYDAEDERVAVIDYAGLPESLGNPSAERTVTERWMARGVDQQVLAEFVGDRNDAGTRVWRWQRDHVFAFGRPLVEFRRGATASSEVRLDLHWDHLGSIRCVTQDQSACAPLRRYLPFGEEMIQSSTDDGQLRFAGHERDDDGTIDQYGDLDAMHARMYIPTIGRFTSIDPVKGNPSSSQSWNRYAYTRNNPTTRIDPDGRRDQNFDPHEQRMAAQAAKDPALREQLRQQNRRTLHGMVAITASVVSFILDPRGAGKNGVAGAADSLKEEHDRGADGVAVSGPYSANTTERSRWATLKAAVSGFIGGSGSTLGGDGFARQATEMVLTDMVEEQFDDLREQGAHLPTYPATPPMSECGIESHNRARRQAQEEMIRREQEKVDRNEYIPPK